MDIRPAEGHGLVEDRKGIPHGTVRLDGNHMEGLLIYGNLLFGGHILEVADDIGDADPAEIVGLASGQDRREHLVLFGGRQNEDGVCGRLLEGLEEGIEGRLGEHVDLIDDVHAVLPDGRGYLYLVEEGLDIVDTVIGCRIQFMDAV